MGGKNEREEGPPLAGGGWCHMPPPLVERQRAVGDLDARVADDAAAEDGIEPKSAVP